LTAQIRRFDNKAKGCPYIAYIILYKETKQINVPSSVSEGDSI